MMFPGSYIHEKETCLFCVDSTMKKIMEVHTNLNQVNQLFSKESMFNFSITSYSGFVLLNEIMYSEKKNMR